MPRRLGVGLTAGEATAIKRVKDIADRLVTTVELIGDLAGMVSPLTGQQNLAPAHGKTLRGSQPGLYGLLLLRRQGTKGNRFTQT